MKEKYFLKYKDIIDLNFNKQYHFIEDIDELVYSKNKNGFIVKCKLIEIKDEKLK